MRIYGTPQFGLRALIVVCGVAGLLLNEQRLVYYTAQSNLIVLAYFVGALYWMVKRSTVDPPAPRWRGAVTLWILITGLISHFLLSHGANPLPGLAAADQSTALANWSLFLVHYVVPVLVLVDWVAFGPHRVVRWRDIPLWIAYPLGYGVLIELRGALFPVAPVRYPYFFLDPAGHGYGWVGLQFLQLGVEFGVLGALIVALDRLASWRQRPEKSEMYGRDEAREEAERPAPGSEDAVLQK
ncbi:Pr6Pr family membrane protein [Actinoplanes sp. CA-030573]|uniref:Pr6Pr family membrane protein n=1 Tax=Actinoplanes sp. CA-030573 TaxID=3239898 RepID=UPI003D8F4B08